MSKSKNALGIAKTIKIIRLPVVSSPSCQVDPLNDERSEWTMLCSVTDLPDNISREANVRPPDISKKIYRTDMRATLVSESGMFHQKNKGITVIAQAIAYDEKTGEAEVMIDAGEGIVDGGHTYATILEYRDEMEEGVQNFVKIMIKVGVPKADIPKIAQGQNTSQQVKAISLADANGYFDWIKTTLKNQPYAGLIGYTEHHKKQGQPVSAETLIQLMVAMDVDSFPAHKEEQPTRAYSGKGSCLKTFLTAIDPDTKVNAFEVKYSGILTEILELHDHILRNARVAYNKYTNGGKGAALVVLGASRDGSTSKAGKAYFTGAIPEEVKHPLAPAALFASMAAFRCLLSLDKKTGAYRWIMPFSAVKTFATNRVLGKLVYLANQGCKDCDYDLAMLGRNSSFWKDLYREVRDSLHDLKASA